MRALNRKVSDEYTVPVCRVHHRDLHGYGDEASWWAGVGIDPLHRARTLAAIEIDILVTCDLVRARAGRLPASTGEGREDVLGQRRQGSDRRG
jgi:hypothetical protein